MIVVYDLLNCLLAPYNSAATSAALHVTTHAVVMLRVMTYSCRQAKAAEKAAQEAAKAERLKVRMPFKNHYAINMIIIVGSDSTL
jgi:hypothetical protein